MHESDRGRVIETEDDLRAILPAPLLRVAEKVRHRLDEYDRTWLANSPMCLVCSKSFLRAAMWKPETWQPDTVPSQARIAKRFVRPEESIEQLERYYGAGYEEGLYPAVQ